MSKAQRSCRRFQHFSSGTAYQLFFLLLLWFLADPHPGIAQNPKNSDAVYSGGKSVESPWQLSLDYTGSLFGYYRVEPDGRFKLTPPEKFKADPEPKTERERLLLGMGDNFSPEFGAGVERELEEKLKSGADNPCYLAAPPTDDKSSKKKGLADIRDKDHKHKPPEILYKDSERVPNLAECDNVARFLMLAGYRAIVPGKEDFIYSALWLRRIALALQAASHAKDDKPSSNDGKQSSEDKQSSNKDKQLRNDLHYPEEPDKSKIKHDFLVGHRMIKNPDHALLMLAANLRWNFTPQGNIQGSNSPIWFPKEDFSEKVQKVCPLMFTWNPPRQDSETCVAGGDPGNTVTIETDWLRRLDITVKADPDCKLPKDDQKDAQKVDVEYCFPVAKSMNMRARSDTTFRRQLLENGAQIAAATLSGEIGREVCSEFKNDTEKQQCIQKLKSISEALETLGDRDHKAFEKLTDKDARLTIKADKQLHDFDDFINKDNFIKKLAKTSKTAQDLDMVLCSLHERLEEASKNDRDFLFPPDVRKAAIRLLLREIAAEQEDVGYTIVKTGSMARTLVIGVIGRESMKAVSPDNLRVCTRLVDGEGRDWSCGDGSDPRLEGTVVVGDPLLAVTTVLRAAWLTKNENSAKVGFDKVVVMAHMPRTQAEELAAHGAASLKSTACADSEKIPSANEEACPKGMAAKAPRIDLILSEALEVHTTPEVKLTYAQDRLIPVIAPKPAWIINQEGTDLIDPISQVTIACKDPNCVKRILDNCEPKGDSETEPKGLKTMAELLYDELTRVALQRPSADLANLENFWNACQGQKACQDSVVTQYLLEQIHRRSHADVVFLQARDFYFGFMVGGYEKYDICNEWVEKYEDALKNQQESKSYCRLRVALDRILWKGDYSEQVVVSGKDLEQLLTIAQQETESEQTLSARDTVEEWLITFGIVTQPPENLSAASMGPAAFSIPGAPFCIKDPGANAEASKYCVNGQRLSEDRAYLVATSDHLAQDKQVYKILKNLDTAYHVRKSWFITGEIADAVFRHGQDEASEKLVKAQDADTGMRKVEELQQNRPILQVDFAKWVAGFMVRNPDQSNAQLAANFSGVTDSRATTPSAQELDLEAVTRMTTGAVISKLPQWVKFGIQSDLEYDRAVTGTLTGAPSVVTYALNSFTTGGFVQFRLRGDLTPRVFLVVAPYQYQTQLTGNFLNFNLVTGTGQLTVSTPRSEGFSHRLGARYEFGGREFPANKLRGRWADSYAEAGPEYSNINEVLSGLLLPDGSVCAASATVPLTNCVSGRISVTPGTVLKPQTETLHTGGLYWDMHLQFTPNKTKKWSLTLDTKGDDFFWPGATLATQTRYAFTTTEALNFKVIGNLQFAPTYSQFFYRNQGPEGESNGLVTKTFSVVAKWYFGRDAAVPFWRQFLFLGPASIDQTKSAKMQ